MVTKYAAQVEPQSSNMTGQPRDKRRERSWPGYLYDPLGCTREPSSILATKCGVLGNPKGTWATHFYNNKHIQ